MDSLYEKFQLTQLFKTYIAQFENVDLSQKLLKLVLHHSSTIEGIQSDVATRIKNNLKESKFDFLLGTHPVICETREFITHALTKLLNKIQSEECHYKFLFVDSWYHVGSRNSIHYTHAHHNCSWCGIFYLDPGDKGSGETLFMNPIQLGFMDAGTDYMSTQGAIDIKPKVGKMILFPSYLQHCQMLYTGDSNRVVVAFNCSVKSKIFD